MENRETLRNLIAFFALAFTISWLLWLPPLLTSTGLAQLPESTGLFGMFAPFGPFVAAFWLTWRQRGGPGLRTLLKRGWSLDFDKAWLLPALFLMPAAGLTTVAVLTLVGESIQWEYGRPLAALGPAFVVILLTQALPEEYGWRGYALGRMLSRWSASVSSLVLGAVWGFWHLPLHFIEGTVQSAIPVYQFVGQQMVLAIFYTWLFNNTRGAVSVSILFHTVGNLVAAAIPYWTTNQGRWIGMGVFVVAAVAIILIWGPQHLSRSATGRYHPLAEES